MKRMTLLWAVSAALLAGSVGSRPASAQPPTLSLYRASVVVTGYGASFNDDAIRFLPAAGVGYSLTSVATLAAEYGRDLAHEGGVLRAGLRVDIAKFGDGAIAFGGNYLLYDGALEPIYRESWEASVHGSFPMLWGRGVAPGVRGKTWAWLVGSVGRDPKNDVTAYRLGVRVVPFGGQPWTEQ